MALEAYVLVKGFEGQSKKAGHPKGSTIVHEVRHVVNTPFDAVHGALTGRRNHNPIEVSFLVDASVYQWYQKLIDKDKNGADKLDVELGFFRSDQTNIGLVGKGENGVYYKINLKDAIVVGLEYTMGDTRALAPGQAPMRQEFIKATLIYREIHWTFADGNKEAMDKWDA